MIELVHTTRYGLGTEWTREDRDILRRSFGALTMAAHDTTDAIHMQAQSRIGSYAARLIAASAAPV